jgi:uncharacterized protein (TIGR03435 family)
MYAKNVTLKRCIIGAYGVVPNQISGGPDWLDTERYEITARGDPSIDKDETIMEMLRDLLADRFRLVMHRERRTMSAFVLEAAKNGPKLEKSATAGDCGNNTNSNNTTVTLTERNCDLDAFARTLGRQMDAPVVNQTGIEGVFNFRVQWTRENAQPAKPGEGAQVEGPTLFTAIQEQLGLRLRAQKTQVEILVIDHAVKPSDN